MPASQRPSPANEVDYASGSLLTLAAILCAGALFRGGGASPLPRGFTWLAGVAALVFFASMIGLWLEPLRQRHGFVRALAVVGAAMLAAGGLAFTRASPSWTLLSYWFPAVLALSAAVVLTRGHRDPDRRPLAVRSRQRAAPRP